MKVLLRLLVLAGAFLWLSAAQGQQFTAAMRVSPCIHLGLDQSPLEASGICSVNAYFEKSESYGVFLQISPKLGRPLDNWEIMAYRPLSVQLGDISLAMWPGVAVGEQQGATYVRIQSDIIMSIQW